MDPAVPAPAAGYAIGVLNHGPSPVSGAEVVDLVPPGLTGCTWSCTASAGSACSPSGNGDLDDLVDLEPGGWADYELICNIGAAGAEIVNTASVTVPAGVTDPEPVNDVATHVMATVSGRVSAADPDALELGRPGSWLELLWGASCLSTDIDYAVYEGSLEDFASHQPIACSTAGVRMLAHTPPAGSTYYLVVPLNEIFEGSYGLATGYLERTAASAACQPRSIAACP